MKVIKNMILGLFLLVFIAILSFACLAAKKNYSEYNPIKNEVHLRGWVCDSKGWRYFLTNNDYYKDGWKWVNSSDYHKAYCYYFDKNGYIYTNTVTPDGYYVNADGQWYDPIKLEVYTKQAYEIMTSITNSPESGTTQNNTGTSAIINATGKPITTGEAGSTSRQLRNNIVEMQNVSIVNELEINGTKYKNLICFESNGAWLTVNMGKFTRLKINATVKDSYIDDTYYTLTVYVNDEEVDVVEFEKDRYENYEKPTQEYILDCENNDQVMLKFSCTQSNKWLKKKLYLTSGVLQR